jgi:Fur family transcriptional regulator, ferric uptake regulator
MGRSLSPKAPEPVSGAAGTKEVSPRNTRQKSAIREVFRIADRPLSPLEVLELAGEHISGLGIATVYRNIKQLIEDEWLVEVELPGEPSRYEVAGKAHHHHFHCQVCGKVFEVPGCALQLKPALPKGFQIRAHELVLYGACDVCAAQA